MPEASPVLHYPCGITSTHPLNNLELLLTLFRLNPPASVGGLGKPEYFWQIIDLLWGKKSTSSKKVFRHPWGERMVELACIWKYLGVHGCGSCVDWKTKILDPETGFEPTIEYLYQNGIAPTVQTLIGPVKAGVPFLKGEEELYEILMEDGSKIIATAGHHVLNSESDFVPVSTLRPGSLLLGYEPCHPRSISGTGQQVRAEDVRNSQKKVAGYRENYFDDFCQRGERPLLDEDTFQSSLPSQAYVQKCKACASSDWDDSERKSLHTHSYRASSPLVSTQGNFVHGCNSENPLLRRLFSGTSSQCFPLSQQFSQSFQEKPLLRTIEEPTHDFSHRRISGECTYRQVFEQACDGYKVSAVPVQAITRAGKRKFYDLTVPFAHHYFAEGIIHHNSGKSDLYALWGIVNWMCDPRNTLVLVTSTSLKDSRKRIWASITSYFQSIEGIDNVGTLVDSVGMIRSVMPDGSVGNDRCGIALIPGEKKKEKEAIGKLIGMKNANVILIADELPELSEALMSAAQSNLSLNPNFQMIGLGNFNSIYDPLGVFVTPKRGWGSITVDDEEWETKEGYCLHLDGMKSPNVLAGEDIYPRIYNKKNLKEHQSKYGHNSPLLWRMCRSFPCPAGEEHCIYSESDFIQGDAHGKSEWMDLPVPLTSADPAFTNEGDEFSVCHARFGRNKNGLPTLEVVNMESIMEDLALTAKGEARDLQTAKRLTQSAQERGVKSGHLGVDCSGPGGLAFGSILSIFWGNNYLPVKFGEVASDMIVSDDDSRKGHEAFCNLSAEVWFMGRAFIRSGQIKGLPQEVAKQMKARHYDNVKQGDFVKIRMESKKDMKKRIGHSPDQAESFLILLHLCRQAFGFRPGAMELAGVQPRRMTSDQKWMNRVKKAHSVYENQFA